MNRVHDLAAIVSAAVAKKASPILFCCREESVETADSGWQFWGHADVETDAKPQIWLVSEVIELEPSLRPFVDSAVGTFLQRKNAHSPWEKSALKVK